MGNLPGSWIRRINIVKMSILLKVIYRFNTITMKIPMSLFTELGKNPKLHMEALKALNSQSDLEQMNKVGGITMSYFKIHHRAIVTQSA
jgi:hypothetical protein